MTKAYGVESGWRLREVLASLLLVLAVATPVAATDIVVSTTDDDTTTNGNCSLAEAVAAANDDIRTDACPAGAGADRIHLGAGSYALRRSFILSADVEISGAGIADTILDSARFEIRPEASVDISRLTMRNSPAFGRPTRGGAIFNSGTLRLRFVAITGYSVQSVPLGQAQGGGIWNGATLTVEHSTISDNSSINELTAFPAGAAGGGIYSSGSLTIIRTAVIDNAADARGAAPRMSVAIGGGIAARSLTLIDSTVSGNAALGSASVGNMGSAGPGIHADEATIINSTISDNVGSPVSAAVAGRSLVLRSATISHNHSAGVFAETINASNTIIANNDLDCAEPLEELPLARSLITSAGHNLDSDGSCALPDGDLSGVDPRLGPLQDNGGSTFTRALLAGSPAIDAGNPAVPGSSDDACPAADQRGVARPAGERCDIGAFESDLAASPTASPSPSPTPTVEVVMDCAGDCDEQGNVGVDDLTVGVRILLGQAPLVACPTLDQDASGAVTVNELVTAINNLLRGCPG